MSLVSGIKKESDFKTFNPRLASLSVLLYPEVKPLKSKISPTPFVLLLNFFYGDGKLPI